MRPDMHKVVTEKPRRGSRIGTNERNTWTSTRQRTRATDFDPRWLMELDSEIEWDVVDDVIDPGVKSAQHKGGKINRYARESKEFSDLLGPLRNFLYAQVGRKWDAVYSEMNATLDKRSLQGKHIWTHVWQYVERNVVFVAGVPYANRRFGVGLYPLDGLYVHPASGILLHAKLKPFGKMTPKLKAHLAALEYLRVRPRDRDHAARMRVQGLTLWEHVEDRWILYTFEETPATTVMRFNTYLNREVDYGQPARRVCVAIKQASQREIKDHWKLLSSSPF